jgi:hypothetical protein
MMSALSHEVFDSSELIEQTFEFWFNDNEHIRSPFPEYIRPQLKVLATEKFFNWINNINEKAKEEINDEIIGERFEEIIFETALDLVITEDEKLTIQYPFLPRLDDRIYENAEIKSGESIITSRAIVKEGDHAFMRIRLKKTATDENWETRFELPE